MLSIFHRVCYAEPGLARRADETSLVSSHTGQTVSNYHCGPHFVAKQTSTFFNMCRPLSSSRRYKVFYSKLKKIKKLKKESITHVISFSSKSLQHWEGTNHNKVKSNKVDDKTSPYKSNKIHFFIKNFTKRLVQHLKFFI